MSRNKGTFNFSANFEPLLKAPLDARQVVGTFADLTDPSTWKDADELEWLYNGLIVGVGNDADPSLNGAYFLKDADNYTNALSWSKLGGGTVIDVSALMAYIDGSIARLDASINQLWTYVDGSITQLWDYLDSSFGGQFVKESSLGPSFYWDASGLLDVSVSGSSFSGDVSTSHVFYDPALDPSLAMPNTVGGIPAGTTVYDLQGDSLRSILNDLLFPTVNPTYVAPSGSFNDNVANLQEIGAMINPQFTASFIRGQILVSGNFQDYRSGLPNQYVFTDVSANTLLIDVSSSSLSNIQTVNNYLVKIGSQSFTSTIYYDAGPQPYDNKGNPYGTPLSAGSVGPYSTSFEGVYPLFATTSNITTLTQQTLVSMLSGNNISMTLVAETGGNKQKFEIPTSWTGAPTNRPLVGVQQYNTFSSQWDTPGGSLAASLTLWSTSSVTESVQGNIINYTRYEYNGTDRGSVQIRLVF